MDRLEGGFIISQTRAVLPSAHRHTEALPGRPISETDLEATNRIAGTGWAVDRFVLGTARSMLVDDAASSLIPGTQPVPIPPRMSDEDWTALGDQGRLDRRAEIARAYAENSSRHGKRQAFLEALDTATRMEDVPAFWFPWTHDFRLRRYPVACGGLSPQGSDISRSLLRFARGKRLGDAGLYWLGVRLANTMGQDKLDLDDRFTWAADRMDAWRRVASDPIKYLDQWQDADSPWAALATIYEFAQATPDFVSHLPVPLDGSCNGLQHLSAMGLDPAGARATNLMAGLARQDVYLEVAEFCIRRVERDAAAGVPEAVLWRDNIGRDTVKRAVLATPYGISDSGIQRQLLEDKRVPPSDTVSPRDASAYFRDVLVAALEGTVVAAKSIMGWIQACAEQTALAGHPLRWTTPTGSTIQQAYRGLAPTRVVTLLGRIQLANENPDAPPDVRKQISGSAPNVVHSFDAAHLALTVNAVGRAYGVEDFAMIHDSFGVHACDTPALGAVLRSEFVEMYRPDRLVGLWGDFRSAAPGVELPPPPPRGAFDLGANVPNAPFFFS